MAGNAKSDKQFISAICIFGSSKRLVFSSSSGCSGCISCCIFLQRNRETSGGEGFNEETFKLACKPLGGRVFTRRIELQQVVHDVDLQKLSVRFALDRARLVGSDGPTHCGAFDVTYMACLPNMVVMAPSDEAGLMHMVATSAAIFDRPSCFRFPRGSGVGVSLPPNNKGTPLKVIYKEMYRIN